MIPIRQTISLLLLLILGACAGAETLRVVTYNALNFRGEQDAARVDDFRRVIDYMDADVVAMQEIISEAAVDYLLSFAFLPDQSDWAAAQFINGPDTDNILFYRTSKVQLVSQRRIVSDPRDINEYVLRPLAPDTSQRIRIYSVHLKAGETDTTRRANACVAFRQVLDSLEAGSLFLMVGDFNLYTAAERAWQVLLSPLPNPNGRLHDPINAPGYPWNQPQHAMVHTQSPRGGSYGGMDDRFDFLLASTGLMDTAGTRLLPETYHAVGNDGLHYNQSINDGVNYAVPDSIADALYEASDHCPVAVDILLRDQSMGVSEPPVVQDLRLLQCYPNPFNSVLTVRLATLRPGASIAVFDIVGRQIMEQPVDAGTSTQLDFSSQTTGTYYIRLIGPGVAESRRVILLR